MQRAAVFARRPTVGEVKTRLSPALPPTLACTLYRGMLADALDAARESSADEVWVYWAGGERDEGPANFGRGIRQEEQQGTDLGERLMIAFDSLLRSAADRAVVIGADCPAMRARHIDSAFAALRSADVVLGPAQDGGYTLIGLNRASPVLFRDVPWSTADVFARTRARAGESGLRVAEIQPLGDLDVPGDLVDWLGRAATDASATGPGLRRALLQIGLLPPDPD